MFIRPRFRKSKKSNGKKIAYWALVESYRTERWPRQCVVAYLGQIGDEEILRPQALGLQYAAEGQAPPKFLQTRLSFNGTEKSIEPQWVEIDVKNVKLENQKLFGAPWLALELVKLLGLDDFLKQHLPPGEITNYEL